jgi:hypothetical protein
MTFVFLFFLFFYSFFFFILFFFLTLPDVYLLFVLVYGPLVSFYCLFY